MLEPDVRPQLVVPLALFAGPGPLPVAVRLEPAVDGLLRARREKRKASCHYPVAGFSFQSQRGVVISLPFLMFLYYCRYD